MSESSSIKSRSCFCGSLSKTVDTTNFDFNNLQTSPVTDTGFDLANLTSTPATTQDYSEYQASNIQTIPTTTTPTYNIPEYTAPTTIPIPAITTTPIATGLDPKEL